MLPEKIISSDGHVYEPADLWTSRMQAALRDKAPRILQRDGEDWWTWDGTFIVGAGAGAQTGLRFEHPEKLTLGDKFENVRPGGYDPEARIKDLDVDGVWAEVVYPTAGLGMHKTVPDSQVFSDICRAYNDWLAEFCGAHPDRLKGIAMLNIDDVAEGVAELQRARKIGLVGATITVGPPADKPYDSPMYEPLWAAAVDLDMPLGLHTGTYRRVQGGSFIDAKDAKPSAISTREYPVRVSLADMIFSGVFERHPRLRVGTVEYELGWIPSFLERMDYTYTQGIRRKEWMRFKGETIPSDFFRRNGFCSFQQDVAGLRDRGTIGLNALMWGSDYPHFESTFPRSRAMLEHMFQDVSDEDTARALGGNAAQLYRIDAA